MDKNKFDHIFICNPKNNFDLNGIKNFCKKINFPLSQIYFFGNDKKFKKYMKQNFLPYFLFSIDQKDFSIFIDMYEYLFRLKNRYYLILNNCKNNIKILNGFNQFFKNIKILNLTSNIFGVEETQDIIFDFLSYKQFKLYSKVNINHFQSRSIWIKN